MKIFHNTIVKIERVKWVWYALVLCMSIAGLSCQIPTEPTALTVPSNLTITLRDLAGNGLPGSRVFLIRDSTGQGVSPASFDDASGIAIYHLQVPILGEAYTAIATAPPATTFIHYTPQVDTIHFRMPCHDTALAITFAKTDSIPCGSLTVERTLDLGTICVDRDTNITLIAGDFKQDCSSPITITSISLPNLPGLTILPLFRSANNVPINAPATWNSNTAVAVRFDYSSSTHQTVVFDGKDVVVDASPSVKITIHLKGRAITCDSCNCPTYDSVSFGLAPVNGVITDTNAASIGDPVKATTVDLSKIVNDQTCDVLFTRIKDFSNPQLRTSALSGSSGATNATLKQGQSLVSLQVDFTAQTRGEFVDTSFYKYQKRAKDGTISDCGTLPIIYHGRVGLGICEFDTASTNASIRSYLRSDTIANCAGSDEQYRYFCIKNIGDGVLRFTMNFQKNDNQFFVNHDINGSQYNGETIVIQPNGSACFSLHFVPNAQGPAVFLNTLNTCAFAMPVVGVARQNCLNCLHGSMSQYGVTQSSFEGFVSDSNAFTFLSDQHATLDVYDSAQTATSALFASMNGTTFQKIASPYAFSASQLTICDDNKAINLGRADCGTGTGTATISASTGDLIMFRTPLGRCGLLYIADIHNENGIIVVVFQATYPL